MRKLYLILPLLFSINFSASADEGMWMLHLLQQLNMVKMNEMGLKLTAEDIYSINKSSLKDAIVLFGPACTGEMVSDKGLLFTNHHCGFDVVQSHSSVDHDYLKDGFWAKNYAEELPNSDLTVSFLIRIADVTQVILSQIHDTLSEVDRKGMINNIISSIEEDSVKGTTYKASVESFYGGNEYYLFIYQTFYDVRLVGVPPTSIGKFGGETDNLRWPRHTGDFGLFRVYCAPDGSPAEYHKNNVPYKPKHFLPISLKGYNNGDFAMVMGYPYTTNRLATSYGIKEWLGITYPLRVEVKALKQNILKEDMDKDATIKFKYASKYAESSNLWKCALEEIEGLNKNNVYNKKQIFENNFSKWVVQDSLRMIKFGNSLDLIKSSYEGRQKYKFAIQYYSEGIIQSIETFGFVRPFRSLYNELNKEKPDTAKINRWLKDEKQIAVDFYKNISFPTEEKVAAVMLQLLSKKLEAEFQPDILKEVKEKYKDDYKKYVFKLYLSSIFTDSSKLFAFLKHPDPKKLKKDMFFQFTISVFSKYREIYAASTVFNSAQDKGERLYIAGVREMQKDKVFYPDANITMRLTYGTVGGYSPSDAVTYDYITTLKGIMEKEDAKNPEFAVPAKLKELYNRRDYQPYSKTDVMPICFITNNDITGGSSGSPVLNGEGQIIGISFDGNSEAPIVDEYYDPIMQKSINVDIRYVLLIIDKFAGAHHLIDELTIIQ